MSFMEGFGRSFSRSFENQSQQNAQDRSDQFKMTYQTYLERMKERKSQELEDTKAANKAKSIVESYGNIPKEAWPKVYNWIQAGLDDVDIRQNLENGSWNIKQVGSQKEVVNTDKKPVDPLTQQTQESGLSPTQAAEPVSQNPQEPVSDNPIKGFFDRIRNNHLADNNQYALKRIGEVSGQSEQDIQNTLTAQTGPKMEDDSSVDFSPGTRTDKQTQALNTIAELAPALAEAEASGNKTLAERLSLRLDAAKAAFKEQEIAKADAVDQVAARKERYEVGASLQKPLEEHRQKVASLKGAVRSYNIMSDIVEKSHGAVLAPVTSSLFESAQKWAVDARTMVDQVNEVMKNETDGTVTLPTEGLSILEHAQKELLHGNQNDLGTQKGLFEIQKAIFAYHLATSVGQNGKNLSEPERKMFTELSSGGVTPDRFHQGMADILDSQIKNADEEGKSIYDSNTLLKTYKNTRPDVQTPEFDYQSLQDELKNEKDPDIQKAYTRLRHNDRGNANPQNPEDQMGPYPIIKTPEEAMKLPKGTVFMTPDGRRKVVP
jgi:hypothetical protein